MLSKVIVSDASRWALEFQRSVHQPRPSHLRDEVEVRECHVDAKS